jgi:hypothetical protein
MGRVGRIDAKNKKKTQTRAILHDDRLFPDPFTFKPERFTTPDMDPRVPAAVDYAFGFGRRVCPGRWMAHSFVWIVVASVLSTFRIEKAVRDGRVIEPTGAFTPGILACVVCLSYLMTSTEQGFFFFLLRTGVRKNSSALLSHGRRRLKRSFARLRRRDGSCGQGVRLTSKDQPYFFPPLFHSFVRRRSQPECFRLLCFCL